MFSNLNWPIDGHVTAHKRRASAIVHVYGEYAIDIGGVKYYDQQRVRLYRTIISCLYHYASTKNARRGMVGTITRGVIARYNALLVVKKTVFMKI